MPESKKRKKPVYAPASAAGPAKKKGPSPVWFAPVMLAFFLIGIVWLVAYYIGGQDLPLVGDLGATNLAIGFGFIIVGFVLSTQWR